MFRMLGALLLVTAAVSAVPPVEPVPAGTPIVSIKIVRFSVFDTTNPTTSSWPYRTANALHVVSRERFIKSLLLFKVGDKLDPAKLAESERLLRETNALNPVHITAHAVQGGAEVVVETHDQWTLEASLNFGTLGNKKHYGISVAEENFLGLGKTVAFDARSEPERDSLTLGYKDPLLFGTRWRLAASHSEATDGRTDDLEIAYPFFALATPRAGGGVWQRDNLTEYLYSGGHRAVSGKATHHALELWAGLKLPDDGVTYDRLVVGVFTQIDRFAGWRYRDGRDYGDPLDRELQGVEAGWQRQTDSWRVVHGFRAWQRQEDVPLGPNFDVKLGFSLPALGGDRSRIRVSGDGLLATLVGPWYTWVSVGLTGRIEMGGFDNGVLHIEGGTARTGPIGFRGRVAVDVSRHLDRDQQLTLGADAGLRGWDPDYFDGRGRAVMNLEYRHILTDEVLHLAVLGMTVFADAGTTWNPRVGASTRGVRSDAGVGLLAEVTRAAILRVIRVELAFPDRGKGPVLVVTGASLF
jgi:hypothetical protein